MSNVATIDRPTGPSIIASMAERYSMAPAAFEQTLRATVVPKECTREQFAAFLVVAHEYGLNPILKEIYAFPAKGGGIQPVVGIDGWVKLMNEHPMMDGIEFDDHLDEKKQLTAISARIYRKDRSHPLVVTEYMAECKRNTEPWKQWPARMLRHKATIQAVRYAFGYSSILDTDEAERMGANVSGMRDVSPPPAPPAAPSARQIASPTPHDEETGEIIEDETGATATADAPEEPPAPPEGPDENNAPTAAPGSPESPPPAPPRPLTVDEKKRLKALADGLSSVNTPATVQKGTQRFWQDAGLGDDDTSAVAVAATAIMDAHLSRTRGETSPADADAAVRKALAA
jgi:phage recombination protein Bet